MSVNVRFVGPITITISDPTLAARVAALETSMAESADAIIAKVKEAADNIIGEVNAVGDRITTDVDELKRRIEAASLSGLSDAQVAAMTAIADSLSSAGETLQGINPLPDYPPTEPA